MSIDISKTIEAKSDQLNADDLIGRSITIEITQVSGSDNAEQPVIINYKGDNGKPYKPCKSMRRVLFHCWGKDGHAYIGRKLTLYCDPKVKFGGLEVGGIRISHASHINEKKVMALTASKANKKPYMVLPLEEVAEVKIDVEALKQIGNDKAKLGMAELKTWFESLSAIEQNAIADIKEELKKIASNINKEVDNAKII